MNDFDKCLKRRSLVRIEYLSAEACTREFAAAHSELEDLQVGLDHGRFKIATTSGYHAMFHAARALVLARGFAEKSHYCLAVALKALYGDTDEALEHVRALSAARTLREHADYQGEYSETGARDIQTVAIRFIEWAERTYDDTAGS